VVLVPVTRRTFLQTSGGAALVPVAAGVGAATPACRGQNTASRPTPVACQFFRADESPFILFPTTLRGVGSDLQPAARNAPAQRTGGDRGPPVSGGSQGVGGPGKPTGPESGAAVVPSCPAGASGPPRR